MAPGNDKVKEKFIGKDIKIKKSCLCIGMPNKSLEIPANVLANVLPVKVFSVPMFYRSRSLCMTITSIC